MADPVERGILLEGVVSSTNSIFDSGITKERIETLERKVGRA